MTRLTQIFNFKTNPINKGNCWKDYGNYLWKNNGLMGKQDIVVDRVVEE